jgi:hypothetical protein
MAISDPTAVNQADYQVMADRIFLGLYSTEMVLKILGYGIIFAKDAYLRDPWNLLDMTIVFSGYLDVFVSSGSLNLGVLRSFRVLRPLRTISGIEGLRILVSALLSAMPLLRDTLLILFFFFFVMGIAGL